MTINFYPVADKSEFSGTDQLHVNINDEEILLCREGDDFYAVSYYCSHATLALEGGYIYKSRIICPYHGAEFCLRSGEALTPPAFEEIKSYPLLVEGTSISVGLDKN
ncbi:MAG: ferredoxin [Gammaproteobacteria bacterium]|nr:ferredoxin [Gammaproteobacteria bacterium]